MKTALIIAGALGALVLVRRAQLGHMPHSLGELLPFLPGGACCPGCAKTGTSCSGAQTSQTQGTPRVKLDVYETPPIIGRDDGSGGVELPAGELFAGGIRADTTCGSPMPEYVS